MTHIDDIRDSLTHSRLCYEAWWLLTTKHPNRGQIVSVCNRYLGFFSTVRPALYATFAVKLASVFGTRSDEISLDKIGGIDQLAEFPGIWERGRKFHKYRSKVIAHRDIDVTHKVFVAESGCLTYDDLKSLLDDTCNIFDVAANKLGLACLSPFTSADDLLEMILALDKLHEE